MATYVRRRAGWAALLLALHLLSSPAPAAGGEGRPSPGSLARDVQVKAALVFNFVKFVD